MSQLHDTATRVVSYALFPAFLAVGGVLVWVNQPIPGTTSVAADLPALALSPEEETLSAPEPVVTVGPVTIVSKPTPAPKPLAAAPVKPKTRHCEEYGMDNSGEEKVVICKWQ